MADTKENVAEAIDVEYDTTIARLDTGADRDAATPSNGVSKPADLSDEAVDKAPANDNYDASLRADETDLYPEIETAAGDAAGDVREQTSTPVLSGIDLTHLDPNEDAELKTDLEDVRSTVRELIESEDRGPLTGRVQRDELLKPLVKQIEEKAFEGIGEAQHDLAAIYTAGHAGTIQNFEKAAFWFREASVRGVSNARYNLGVLYHQGLGVDADLTTAINWYRAAAVLNHPEAQYNLGIAHIEGIGAKYNPKLATYYFTSAAMQGIVEAAYNLGLIYENGLLGEEEPEHALFWYHLAAKKGSSEALSAKEQLQTSALIGNIETDAIVEKYMTAYSLGGNKQASASSINTNPDNEATRAQSELVKRIQDVLIGLKLYPGPADGIIGPKTEDAIRSYQRDNDLAVTGEASASLLAHMKAN